MDKPNTISAIILAGGESRRFKYRDKGLIQWRGKAMVQHVIEHLKPQVDQILISCNRNIDEYEQWGYPCLSDLFSSFQGPLAGIQRGLSEAKSLYCLSCPCDTPALPNDLVKKLRTELEHQNADIAFVVNDDRKHYTTALMKTSVKSSLDVFLKGEDRRVRAWLKSLNSIEVRFSEQEPIFHNINTQEILDGLKK